MSWPNVGICELETEADAGESFHSSILVKYLGIILTDINLISIKL